MQYILNTDSIMKSLKKLTGGEIPPGGFFGDWVDTQLELHARELNNRISGAAEEKVGKFRHIYHASITVGKPYTLKGIRTIRVFAKRPAYHANLIEYGFYNARTGDIVPGKKIFTKAAQDYEQQLADEIDILFSKKVEELIE